MTRLHAALWFVSRLIAIVVLPVLPSIAQTQAPAFTDQEKNISQQIRKLRSMPDDERAVLTRRLALDIRQLPISGGRVQLATGLASLSTEGDFGHDTLQEVCNTLSATIQEYEKTGQPGEMPYGVVASLVRYEGVKTALSGPRYEAAMADLDATDRARANSDFELSDLQGKQWTLKQLKGKVVIVNFWATWCPPCRKEIADLNRLYDEFKGRGFVVLGVSDDDVSKLKKFAEEQNITYPVLPDLGRKVHTAFRIDGIPVSLVYDREGKLAGQAIDMRTRQQFLRLLAQAGLE